MSRDLKILPSSAVPIFQQIADGIRGSVAAGIYRPGDPIPSIRAQAIKLLINPNTIKRAYDELEREGLIYSRKGLGMFVTERASDVARASTEALVRDTLAQGIAIGRSAHLTRARIDDVYREAWGTDGRGGRTVAVENGTKS